MREHWVKALAATSIGLAVTISSVAIKFWHTTSLEIALLRKDIEELSKKSNADAEAKQDDQLQKQWQYLGWTRDQINELRAKNGWTAASWPRVP